MGTLRFATDGSRVAFNLPAVANFTGNFTLAALIRRRITTAGWHAIINHGPASLSATPVPNFEFNANNLHLDAGSIAGELAFPNDVANWYIVAVTKTAGSTVPVFHYKRIDDASAWVHTAGSNSVANPASQTGWRIVYGIWQGSDQSNMNMALGAGWGTSLGNADIESLLTNKRTSDWRDHFVAPAYLHELRSKTDIPDIMGNGATLHEVTGTTVEAEEPPGWTFDGVATPEIILPDADLATTGWTSTPLWSKLNDSSDATIITGALS